MGGNSVMWQPKEVEDLLLYFKEKIQECGKALVLRDVHHDECARRLNEKYGSNFTGKQVYNKYHKLKAEWKVIMDAKAASGASFDNVQKKIIYDEVEVVKMKSNGDKRAKYFNVPIPCYDEMEFVFIGKHATGEFSAIQAPFDRTARQDDDFNDYGRHGEQEQVDVDNDPCQYYDSDTLPDCNSPTAADSKRYPEDKKKKKRKRAKEDNVMVQDVTGAMNKMSDTMHFTHVTDPNEAIYKFIDKMDEYPLPVRLELQTYLAENGRIASMLKGRPEESIKQWVAMWVMERYPFE